MMSNNTFSNTYSSTSPLAKQEELQNPSSTPFFAAGGAPTNIPQAPPAPTNLNNVRSRPINLKTRNWGNKLENETGGFSGLNRSLYDRPNVFAWDGQRPSTSSSSMPFAPVVSNNNNLSSFPSSSITSTSSSSRAIPTSTYGSNIPPAPQIHRDFYKSHHHKKVNGKHLRLRNWGHPSEHGWSGVNRELYLSGMTLERDVLMNELRYKYGPRPNLNQERAIMPMPTTDFMQTIVPTTTTTFVETGPTKVLATTVPVPMLNPPINDGRRYAKLYAQNTNALSSGKGVSKLVKRRGTRRDHLVQPTTTSSGFPITTTALPLTTMLPGATVVQPATLVAETRSILPTNTLVGTPATILPTTVPAAGLSRKEKKRQNKELKDQQRFVKKEQRAARKATKRNPSNLGLPVAGLPLATPSFVVPGTTAIPLGGAPYTTTTALPLAAPMTTLPLAAPYTTTTLPLVAPTTTMVGSPMLQQRGVIPPINGVSNQPLDHSKVLAGQLGNAPVKRPRRARKAKKGSEQPLYSNVIASTPAPLAAITTTTPTLLATPSYIEPAVGTTVVQPLTLVSETRNVLPPTMLKQETIMTAPLAPYAVGNPVM